MGTFFMSGEANDKYILKSLYNALGIIDILHDSNEIGVSEISRQTGQSKANIFRVLYTLQIAGYVEKTKDNRYKLSLKFAHYGNTVISRIDTLSTARPYLKALSERFGQATHYAVLDENGYITFLCRETPNPFFQSASHAGYRMEAYSTANGKMLLSLLEDDKVKEIASSYSFRKLTQNTITNINDLIDELHQIRKQGYAEDIEESEIGLYCISVPIFTLGKQNCGSISCSGSATYITQNKSEILQALQETAATISKNLGNLN